MCRRTAQGTSRWHPQWPLRSSHGRRRAAPRGTCARRRRQGPVRRMNRRQEPSLSRRVTAFLPPARACEVQAASLASGPDKFSRLAEQNGVELSAWLSARTGPDPTTKHRSTRRPRRSITSPGWPSPRRGRSTKLGHFGSRREVALWAVATQCLPVSEPIGPRVAPAPRTRSTGSHWSIYRSSQQTRVETRGRSGKNCHDQECRHQEGDPCLDGSRGCLLRGGKAPPCRDL